METGRSLAVERALRDAAPDRLVDVLRSALRERYGALSVAVRLVDYAMHSLQPALPASPAVGPVPVDGSPHGRSFGSQEPFVVTDGPEEVELHLPVTLRGDRVGVLSVTLSAAHYTSEVLAELQHIATVTAREITLAGRETDRYEVERRAERLTLAAEMQWLLLPSRSCERAEFALGAHLEPAYAIYGDGFDWTVSAEHLTVTVANGMGEGVNAALLTNLVISALRNARRAGLGLAGQAALADEAVFAQHRGDAYVATLLLRIELATGLVEVVDAGSPRVWRLRAGIVESVDPDHQTPLGMFGDTPYRTEQLRAEPGDRLLIASDGVYGAVAPSGMIFEHRLERTVRATRLLRASQVPTAVLRDVADHHAGSALDDAVVVCVDWHGPRRIAATASRSRCPATSG
jgi:serine phosphatase RsbU (regulator of sigma subunit)